MAPGRDAARRGPRRAATASTSSRSTRPTATVTALAEGGSWGAPHWTADGAVVATHEDAGTAPRLCLVTPGNGPQELHAPTPLAVRAAPHVRPEDVTFTSFDGVEIHALPVPAGGRDGREPGSCGRLSARRPDRAATATSGTATRSTSSTRATPGWRRTSAARPATGATSSGSTIGDWGVGDTKDCLAAADFLRTLDWVDGEKLGIFGASYGSYMALLAVTDDPEHRFRCAVAKYGDCNILTSWAQGDRDGVQDMRRMMPHPSRALAAYVAGSPVHRLENVEVPLLIAHGELDLRVSPKQSEELVAGAAAARRQAVRVRDLPHRGPRASCAPARRSTSTGGWSGSSTGT